MDNIQPVSPDVVSGKLSTVIMTIYNTIAPVIYPLALLGFIVALLFLLIGAIFHSKVLKKMGSVDFVITAAALVLYSLLPTFLGLLKTISNIVK
ncbi:MULTISPECIES: hypothetical protein [Clostridium]|uniref:hypothetical protein n=1 Tax=Clostridium TaxID=1485 RepID=UPI0008270FF9|nr:MULTISPECIES: hypothetical protein [Clostridium]PJI06590.1 hypothetical protein CUB90_01345 [Clostridium sp. CT7]